MSEELVTWLRNRLDEDERAARAADVKQGDPDWWVSEVKGTGGEHFTVRSRRDSRPIARIQRLDGDQDEPAAILDGAAVAAHIARHDPWRVLVETGAKLDLIDLLVETMEGDYAPWNEDALRLLALPYADCPGYLDEWRPDRSDEGDQAAQPPP